MCWELSNLHNTYSLSVDTMEAALQACAYAVPAFDLIVIDTLTALPTREDLRLPMGEADRLRPPAKILAQALPQLKVALSKSGCTLVLVNQLRERAGVLHGNPETVPGGTALKYYADIRLDVRRTETLRKARKITGQRVKVKVVKNKCAPPFREAVMDLHYGQGLEEARRQAAVRTTYLEITG